MLSLSRKLIFRAKTSRRLLSSALGLNRNIGIVAHVDAGKTTTSEHMLNLCGASKSVGRVDTGDTVMDFLPQERERGITIQSAAISMQWKEHTINLIDTPGHVDFTVEVERCARVLDGVVVVIDAVSGVQAQTRTVWKQTQRRNLPAVVFVNKMDRTGASFSRTLDSARTKLSANTVALQLPIGSEENFDGVVDLVSMKRIEWQDSGEKHKPRVVESELKEESPLYKEAMEARRDLMESLAECDELFMEAYLEAQDGGGDITSSVNMEDLTGALRRACLSGALVPAICGASLRGKGVQAVLDSVLSFLPSPLDAPPTTGIHLVNGKSKEISVVNTKDLCLFAFKIVYDQKRGPLVFVRNYSGTLSDRSVLFNTSQGKKERVNQLLLVTADDLDQVKELGPGEVGCLVGLKHTRTGDTLVLDKGPLQSYSLEGLHLPNQVFALSIEPEKSSQQTELEEALYTMCVEDPSLIYEIDEESGQNMIRGLGELHLEIVCDKLKRQHGIEVYTGDAYVAYRETLTEGSLTESFVYDRMIGVKRMYAEVELEVTALGTADDPVILVAEEAKEGLTLDERVSLVEGVQASLLRGPRGFPVVGIQVMVKSVGRDHDTTPGSMRACCALILDSILRGKSQALLEPIMALEVEVPSRCVGDVLSDLTVKRRAQVKDIYNGEEDSRNNSLVLAHAPLAGMLGYATSIRSMTQGEGSFSMEFLRFSEPMDDHSVADALK